MRNINNVSEGKINAIWWKTYSKFSNFVHTYNQIGESTFLIFLKTVTIWIIFFVLKIDSKPSAHLSLVSSSFPLEYSKAHFIARKFTKIVWGFFKIAVVDSGFVFYHRIQFIPDVQCPVELLPLHIPSVGLPVVTGSDVAANDGFIHNQVAKTKRHRQ